MRRRIPAFPALHNYRDVRFRLLTALYLRLLLFLALDLRPELFFAPLFFEVRLRGTLAPDARASLSPMAIACSRLFTLG